MPRHKDHPIEATVGTMIWYLDVAGLPLHAEQFPHEVLLKRYRNSWVHCCVIAETSRTWKVRVRRSLVTIHKYRQLPAEFAWTDAQRTALEQRYFENRWALYKEQLVDAVREKATTPQLARIAEILGIRILPNIPWKCEEECEHYAETSGSS